MTDKNNFAATYGPAVQATASERVIARLSTFSTAARLPDIGIGVFDDGFVSVGSIREDIDPMHDLRGWDRWLPPNSVWFASSAFGMLFIASPPDGMVWLVNTQIGSILPTDFPADEAVQQMAASTTRDGLLKRPLFREWRTRNRSLADGWMLISEPAVVELGDWKVDAMRAIPPADFLSATAASFHPIGPTPISLMDPEA